jgi:anion-transporting  ArsA/GET3 family ATPase
MGIGDKTEPQRVHHEGIKGELWAAVIDNKKTFDEFILRAARNSEAAKSIFQNKLYIQLSTTLSGSQEFTALEKLYSAAESGLYDLVVLDTPPTKHAIDFLEAPQKLALLFQESVAKWFRQTGEGSGNLVMRFLSASTGKVLSVLENLTGDEFMKELGNFFRNIHQWQDKLENRIIQVQALLTSPTTEFVLVTSNDRTKLREAQYFEREIEKGGFRLAGVIINRAKPYWMENESGVSTNDLERQIFAFYKLREEALVSFNKTQIQRGRFVVKIPELQENIQDIETVMAMAKTLGESFQ